MNGHLNFHDAQLYEPKISSRHLLEKLATKALAKVPGSQTVINNYFKISQIQSDLKPSPPKNLIFHSGTDTV